MISAYIGEDTRASKNAFNEAISLAAEQHKNALTSRFDDLNFSKGAARDALGAISMFGSPNIIVFDGVYDHEEGKDVANLLLEYKDTDNLVFLRENTLSADERSKLKKVARMNEFLLKASGKKERPSNFNVADAIARRDRKGAWVEFERARRSGAQTEEIHGIIFWQIKTLLIVKVLSREDALAVGVKDYSYRMASVNAKKFLEPELNELLTELKDMYHRAHRGEGDLDIALEKFTLSI